MARNDYKIFQAKILNKDTTNPRQYTCVQIPEGYKIVGVQLPTVLKDQSAPLIGSVVLILQLDAYRSYILSVLREPFPVLTSNNQYRGFIPSSGNIATDISMQSNPIQDGEIFMEATGPLSPTGQVIPGFGAHLYLGNNGSAQIASGSMGEQLIVGGTSSDDDHEVLLSGPNGFFESTVNGTKFVQTTLNFDSLNNLTIGNQIIPGGDPSVFAIPIAEMTIDGLGNIELFNTTFGTGVKLASMIFDIVGNISIKGTTITLNSGTEGAARIADTVTSNPAIDILYFQWVTAIQSFFTAISVLSGGAPVTQSQLGALGQAFLAQSATAPSSITSKISSGSSSVFIGG